jgi:uncharacterized glyoxalase superfamily protein PhnB
MKLNRKLTLLGLISLGLLTGAVISLGHTNVEKKTMINRSTPILHVKAVEPSLKFWTDRFGFKTTIQVPEGNHIGFAAIENGSTELMFQTYEGMQNDANNPLAKAVDQGPSFLFMEVPDINAAGDALKGAEIVQGLHETFYGSKEIVAKEPGGHFVIFSQLPKK